MDERPIRTSAKALVIKDGRALAIRLRDADGEFYIMPGGGQRAGELLPEAARREVLEETGLRVSPRELAERKLRASSAHYGEEQMAELMRMFDAVAAQAAEEAAP